MMVHFCCGIRAKCNKGPLEIEAKAAECYVKIPVASLQKLCKESVLWLLANSSAICMTICVHVLKHMNEVILS